MDEITTLLEMIENVAPEVWRIAMQQVAVDIRVNAFWVIFLGITAVVSAYVSYRAIKSGNCDAWEVYLPCTMLSFLAIVITAVVASCLYSAIVNPEYAAIKLLSGMMGGN